MRKNLISAAGMAAIAALYATPAFAGFNGPTPEPEVAGSILALGALGLGFRFFKRRVGR
ncbi:MAG: hypothetical protein ACKOPQ_03905 [Novosphingobium sp.]|jgi:hypothetical protein